MTVFGGGGALEPGERAVWNLPRSGAGARMFGALLRRDPYFIEQATFFAGFARALTAGKPDVVYFADLNLGNACWHWRRFTAQRFKLLYYNGGPTTRPFTRCDLVQQVSPEHLASALARGESADRQVLLPHGMRIAREYTPASHAERDAIRAGLGVPIAASLVLAVGALNRSHKRMDYVIDEVAQMPTRPHLLMLGAVTPETPDVLARARARLGDRFTARTLPRADTLRAYRAADVFVHAAMHEGFGLAQLEALDAGLPCVVHDTPTSAYVVGDQGVRVDLTHAGALAAALDGVLAGGRGDGAARHAWAWSQFSWDRLAPRYAELLTACADGHRSPDSA
jgi:glycosyltransferase involved in cell wall biosynthesis